MLTPKKRSPLKQLPRRVAGQSLREKIDNIRNDQILPWVVLAMMAVVMAVSEWFRWKFPTPPNPIFLTIIAVVIIGLACRKVCSARPQLEMNRLGLAGEQFVGQFLQDELISKGYRVVHDVEDDRGNIDHVAIGPNGIFSIETKTASKPERGAADVVFDGRQIFVNGNSPDRDPVIQARACAGSVERVLREYTGRELTVRPVVLYPGWFVREPVGKTDVWVLNPDRFIGYVKREPQILSQSDIDVLTAALDRYVADRKKSCRSGNFGA